MSTPTKRINVTVPNYGPSNLIRSIKQSIYSLNDVFIQSDKTSNIIQVKIYDIKHILTDLRLNLGNIKYDYISNLTTFMDDIKSEIVKITQALSYKIKRSETELNKIWERNNTLTQENIQFHENEKKIVNENTNLKMVNTKNKNIIKKSTILCKRKSTVLKQEFIEFGKCFQNDVKITKNIFSTISATLQDVVKQKVELENKYNELCSNFKKFHENIANKEVQYLKLIEYLKTKINEIETTKQFEMQRYQITANRLKILEDEKQTKREKILINTLYNNLK